MSCRKALCQSSCRRRSLRADSDLAAQVGVDLQYAQLLATLDEAASRAIGDALKAMDDVLCEPAVARILSEHLPPGERQGPLLLLHALPSQRRQHSRGLYA